ncbi:cyclase [Umezawaea tangerina]|uniref:Dehydratase n=1 Tax=Umezawaea tangerina TaxID=84725 RepID=A0A2T0SRW9_9PSEU|nr:cyclase [Umezawaea tangerina]PRY36157.1 dehydratase [Umezawaea tangerina]
MKKLAGIAAMALLLATSAPASAAPSAVTYKLKATALGQSAEFTLDQTLDATAPETAAPGGTVTAVIDPAPNKVPASAGGYTVREIKTITLKLPVPANATFRSATATGGAGLGNGTPTVSLSGTDVVLKIAGPIKGGADFELPTITLNLTAGASGTITTKLGGTSYTAPGLTFTATITALGFPIDAPATGYPDPNPALTTTTIG